MGSRTPTVPGTEQPRVEMMPEEAGPTGAAGTEAARGGATLQPPSRQHEAVTAPRTASSRRVSGDREYHVISST